VLVVLVQTHQFLELLQRMLVEVAVVDIALLEQMVRLAAQVVVVQAQELQMETEQQEQLTEVVVGVDLLVAVVVQEALVAQA
jgi:hypothetical protein